METHEYLKTQYFQLVELHAKLEQQLVEGYSNYVNDPYLSKLKLEKLTVKREIDKINRRLQNEESV